jgi:Tol biopolymer transport system component
VRRILTVVLVLTFLVVSMPTASATFPGGNGKIAYSAHKQIHVIDPDGSGLAQLTFGKKLSRSPAWSPDGTKIAFVRGNKPSSLFIMNADGTDRTLIQRRISERRWYFFGRPAWSPDGTQIAFSTAAKFVGAGGERRWSLKLYVVNSDGSGLTRISRGRHQDSGPSWSPDGTRIAFTTRRGSLATMNPDGSHRTLLVRRGGDPDWSPDGSRITFVRSVGRSATDVFLANSDGTDRVRLTDTPDRWEFSPVFSPDGTEIAFLSENPLGAVHIFVLSTGGTDIVRVTDMKVSGGLSWQPT